MSFTRFNYDDARTMKKLEEATGPGRYILNQPGNGSRPIFINDPQIRVGGWGANLMKVRGGGHPIDIDSDLSNRSRRLTKYCAEHTFPNKGVANSYKVSYPTHKPAITDETRTTHPAWTYRTLEHNNFQYLHNDPQENVCKHFENNLNTRLMERDNYVPQVPCLKSNGNL